MKNIKEIIRGNDSVSLQFVSKKNIGNIIFLKGIFALDKTLTVNGNIAITGDVIAGESSVADLETRLTQLEEDYIALEARVSALEP